MEADNVADVRMWAFCIGFRNLLAGIGTIVGLVILWTGDEATGRAIVITALCYMLLASLAMGIADLLGLWRPRGGSMLGTSDRGRPSTALTLLVRNDAPTQGSACATRARTQNLGLTCDSPPVGPVKGPNASPRPGLADR